MKYIFIFIYLLSFAFISKAQLPEPYKKVDQIICLVNDIERVTEGWKKFGFQSISGVQEVEFDDNQFRGKTTDFSAKVALGKLGEADVSWLQPLAGESYFAEYHKQHGSVAFSLVHRFPNVQSYEQEIERLQQAGIEVVQQGKVKFGNEDLHYAFFDTYEKGDYVLGITTGPDIHANIPAQAPFSGKFNQYAFATNRPEEVSLFWESIGIPAMNITHTPVWEKRYYGKEHDFDMKLGWQRHGNVVYEWCIPLKEPTVYSDHIEKRGAGIQHLGLNVPDIDEAIRVLAAQGFAVAQSGGWGDKGKPGSGRFAYIDTDRYGGLMVELLWSFKAN